MNILHFLIKDIFRKKTRALLTICGISVGVCVCIIMLGIGESIKNSFKDVYGKRQIDIIIQEKEQLSILLSRVDAGIATDIKRIPSVGDATATLLYIHKLKASAVPVFGWEPDSFLFDAVELLRGRRPVAAKNEVMAGEALARSLDKDKETQINLNFANAKFARRADRLNPDGFKRARRGDPEDISDVKYGIKIKGVAFRVVGVFKSTSPFEQYAAVMPLSDLQATIHEAGKASFINVRLKPSYRTETMMENITRELETDFPLTAAMRADAFISEKTQFIVVGEQFSFLVSLITIIAVALGLANTMVASAFEKRKFLAILLALGWQKIEIAALFMFEALIVVILGGAIGIFLGFKGTGYIFGLTSIQAFVPDLNAVFMLKIVGMILGSAVVAAIVPIWTTLNSDPVETIRSE